ncbi:hypothetical protein [Litorihabitans aurantiacus]|uniref:SRPBCC family protein n=1 Tax=Litorihabitans aurantiacus TaxID=1930061 RepID=A0AA37XED9_9MICO|nr:hypothetical protein [Litorihabitans aurantiacus]GMA31702.1 hypothetical protein GCM10025875_16940 [Litorihabitans aurantiacus]
MPPTRRPRGAPRAGRQIYVETVISAASPDVATSDPPRSAASEARTAALVDRVWHPTQDPLQHPRWDLRFTHITPQECAPAPSRAHRFRYEIRAPGRLGDRLALRGWGTSVGHRRGEDGHGTSALRFAPDDVLSPLGPGQGYWRYVPTPGGVRFVTGYDYTPGWGPLGPHLDPLVRPLVGWATAWSFDRLRLWVERGTDPARARDAAIAVAALRALAVATGAHLVVRTSRRRGRSGVLAVGTGLALLAAAVVVPTPAGVPSARRTLRRPPDPSAARAPRSLDTLAADPHPRQEPA